MKLLQPLSKAELTKLFKKLENGDKQVIETIILHNLILVAYCAKKYQNEKNSFEDLYSIGIIGLMKAVNTFDFKKNISFSSYAITCIRNEMFMEFRRNKKHYQVISLDELINIDNDLTIKDTFMTEENIQEDYNKKETLEEIIELLKDLPESDQKIITQFFGIDCKKQTQYEISKELKISQSYISRLIDKAIDNLKQLYNFKFQETPNTPSPSYKEASRVKTIYNYFKNIPTKEVDKALQELTSKERTIIDIRIYNSNEWKKLSKKEHNRFYYTIQKMKANIKKQNNIRVSLEKSTTTITNSIDKKDLLNTFDQIETKMFKTLLNFFSFKNSLVLFLKLGFYKEKKFSNEEISKLLDINIDEIIQMIQEMVNLLKKIENSKLEGSVKKKVRKPNE